MATLADFYSNPWGTLGDPSKRIYDDTGEYTYLYKAVQIKGI